MNRWIIVALYALVAGGGSLVTAMIATEGYPGDWQFVTYVIGALVAAGTAAIGRMQPPPQ